MRKRLERPCRPAYPCELHHVYGGARRRQSERYNCVIWLPPAMHNQPPNGVHHNRALAEALKAEYQRRLEEAGWTREEFLLTFGRSYLDD